MMPISLENAEELMEQLKFLKLPKGRRKQLHRWLASAVATMSRKRVRQQKDVDGKSFTPRKSSTNKRPMLKKISNTKFMKPSNVSETGADVTWPKNRAGMIARVHQEGQTIRITKKAQRAKSDALCSRYQAKQLNKLGFRLRLPGGNRKRVSQKWLMDNMTAEQAGLIIQSMGGGHESKGKNSWQIKIPARPFLGASRREQKEMSTKLLNQLIDQIKR